MISDAEIMGGIGFGNDEFPASYIHHTDFSFLSNGSNSMNRDPYIPIENEPMGRAYSEYNFNSSEPSITPYPYRPPTMLDEKYGDPSKPLRVMTNMGYVNNDRAVDRVFKNKKLYPRAADSFAPDAIGKRERMDAPLVSGVSGVSGSQPLISYAGSFDLTNGSNFMFLFMFMVFMLLIILSYLQNLQIQKLYKMVKIIVKHGPQAALPPKV
jgi:hypothetical protein